MGGLALLKPALLIAGRAGRNEVVYPVVISHGIDVIDVHSGPTYLLAAPMAVERPLAVLIEEHPSMLIEPPAGLAP